MSGKQQIARNATRLGFSGKGKVESRSEKEHGTNLHLQESPSQ